MAHPGQGRPRRFGGRVDEGAPIRRCQVAHLSGRKTGDQVADLLRFAGIDPVSRDQGLRRDQSIVPAGSGSGRRRWRARGCAPA